MHFRFKAARDAIENVSVDVPREIGATRARRSSDVVVLSGNAVGWTLESINREIKRSPGATMKDFS